MDAQTIRRAIRDFIRFDPKRFSVTASPTSLLVGVLSPNGPQAALLPFELISADTDSEAKVRVVESTLAGDIPDGFSPGDVPPFLLSVNDGDSVWGVITIDVSGEVAGPVVSRALDSGAVMPDDDPLTGTFYVKIGTVVVSDSLKSSPVNVRYGPIDGTGFRVWFANPKAFGFAWTGSP